MTIPRFPRVPKKLEFQISFTDAQLAGFAIAAGNLIFWSLVFLWFQ